MRFILPINRPTIKSKVQNNAVVTVNFSNKGNSKQETTRTRKYCITFYYTSVRKSYFQSLTYRTKSTLIA